MYYKASGGSCGCPCAGFSSVLNKFYKVIKLIRLLKDRAEDRTCFDIHGDSYDKTSGSHNDAFHDGSAWGAITFSREVLGEMGVKFEKDT